MSSAAICDHCKTPIIHPNPAYGVNVYDPDRLLEPPIMPPVLLHYKCIKLFYEE